MMEGKKIEHEVKIKCILNNDNSYKKLEETLTKIHIKTVISCIEADKYCYTGKFDTLSESDITDISNKYNTEYFYSRKMLFLKPRSVSNLTTTTNRCIAGEFCFSTR